MINRTILQLTEMISCEVDQAWHHISFHGVSTDSRTIEKGNLFIPLIGESFDGHDYAAQAMESGAAAVLWQEDHPGAPEGVPVIRVADTLVALQQLAAAYRQQLPVRVIGVTGSNGKTTTKDMIAACLATTYTVLKTQGNLNNHIGLPLTLLQLTEETQMAVIEMGMSGRGEIELLTKIAGPEAAVITNIGEAHMLQLGSREEIAAAKLEIIAGLREDGLLVYNGDEPLIEQQLKENEKYGSILRFRFGAEESNDYFPVAVMQQEDVISFKLNVPFSPTFKLPIPGRHNVMNALAAIAVCRFMGVSEADIVQGLAELQVSEMRNEYVKTSNGATLINDAYNSSPTALRAAIRMLEELQVNGRKIAVLSDMLELGEQSEHYHREIGRMLDAEKIDYVWTYGPLAAYIAEEAKAQYPEGHVRVFTDKDELASELASLLKEEDLALFKASRGMRLEEVIERLR